MSVYPHAGGAMINAFNSSLFDSCKSAGWQHLSAELCRKYPELDTSCSKEKNFDRVHLTRADWATQAGMVSGLLRHRLSNLDYSVLKIRYTFDGEMLTPMPGVSVRLMMTDNLRNAFNDGSAIIMESIMIDKAIPQPVKENAVKVEYLALRALRPDVIEKAFQAKEKESQRTITNQQYMVKKVVDRMVRVAYQKAELLLEEGGLVSLE